MCENRKPRSERHRKARLRPRFHFPSFSIGVLMMLVVGALVLLNGRGGDPLSSPPAASFTAEARVAAAAESTPSATPAVTTAPNPEKAPEPTLGTKDVSALVLAPSALSSSESAEPTEAAPLSVSLNVKDTIEMKVGETGRIKAKLNPPDASASLQWKSSDEKVVKVDQKGNVKAVGAGAARVGLWVNGGADAAATVSIQVEEPSSGGVWITSSGKKYHSSRECSNMKNPRKVSPSEAKAMGYTACKKCY